MRIALVCPYSLSQPGGVQGQVLGLARSLVAMGHDALVLAPADGPVDTGDLTSKVVVLGRSLPVPANGSRAPVSLGPVAAGRAVRTIRRADVIFVVQNGAIVERGNHDELLKSGGLYSELYTLQFQTEDSPQGHELIHESIQQVG